MEPNCTHYLEVFPTNTYRMGESGHSSHLKRIENKVEDWLLVYHMGVQFVCLDGYIQVYSAKSLWSKLVNLRNVVTQ